MPRLIYLLKQVTVYTTKSCALGSSIHWIPNYGSLWPDITAPLGPLLIVQGHLDHNLTESYVYNQAVKSNYEDF